ncbi:MAG: hypothetical protein ACREAE_00605 [Nitrosopumilaceae archaeon]
MLLGRAPLRISFSGGGTDLEEYHSRYDGYTISSTINKYTYVIAKFRRDNLFQGFSPDFASHLPPKEHHKITPLQGHEIVVAGLKEMNFSKGVDMFLSTDVEANSGLGASSSLTANLVNVILALQRKKWNKNKIAMKAYEIGHDILKWGIGKQDEFAAVYGGLNIFKFTKDKVTSERIKLNKATEEELQNNSMLFHLGKRSHSANILKAQISAIKKSNPITISALHKVKELTLDMRDALRNNDLVRFSEIINESWVEKRKYTKGISNPRIEAVSRIAFSGGATALKVTGSGGGGHMYVFTKPSRHHTIEVALRKFGVPKVDFIYQKKGAMVLDIDTL